MTRQNITNCNCYIKKRGKCVKYENPGISRAKTKAESGGEEKPKNTNRV